MHSDSTLSFTSCLQPPLCLPLQSFTSPKYFSPPFLSFSLSPFSSSCSSSFLLLLLSSLSPSHLSLYGREPRVTEQVEGVGLVSDFVRSFTEVEEVRKSPDFIQLIQVVPLIKNLDCIHSERQDDLTRGIPTSCTE